MTPPTINIALVDSQLMIRKIIAQYLSSQTGIQVKIQAPDPFELIHKLTQDRADILIIDILAQDREYIDALKILRAQFPTIKIIALTLFADIPLIADLLEIGVHAFIPKSDEPEELLLAVKSAANDKIYRNKLLIEALYWSRQDYVLNRKTNIKVPFDDREKTIIRLLWEEKSNKEIANQLFLSIRSIEKIRQNMKEKLDVKTTLGLIKYALINNIIDFYPHKATNPAH